MPKSTTWQSPLTTRHFKTPVGPLAEVDPGMCYDFSRQRAIIPHPPGARDHAGHAMNSSGLAAQADVTSLDTNGTGSPFIKPE